MPFPRPTLTALRSGAMQDITASDLPNADGFMRRSVVRVLAWVQAGLAFLHYGYLDWISLQSTPFTATDEYLEGWAALAPTPVLRESPTYASGPATWNGTPSEPLPVNTLCATQSGVQYLTAAGTVGTGGTVTVTVTAVVAGSAGNTDSGTPLTLSTVVSGINPTGSASATITGGADLEQDPSLKTRMLESYAAPPHGGNQADYVTWALQVIGVTRAWCLPIGAGAGTVVVYFMMDAAEAAHGGFPQGTNGTATLETRGTGAATGDQLAVANSIYPLRPVTALVYADAPTAQTENFTIDVWSSLTTTQQGQVSAALTGLFLAKDTPLGTTSIEQSDVNAAITAIGGLPSFAVTSPSSWPITSTVGNLFTLGTIS